MTIKFCSSTPKEEQNQREASVRDRKVFKVLIQALCLFSEKLGFHFLFVSLPVPFPHRFFPSLPLNRYILIITLAVVRQE